MSALRPYGLALLVGSLLAASVTVPAGVASAAGAEPTAVTIAGSLQSELGCPGDWDPACATTHLALDATDGVWQGTFTVPAGDYEYKAALNDAWDESYGLNAGGNNIPLSLSTDGSEKFYYDNATHWVALIEISQRSVATTRYPNERT